MEVSLNNPLPSPTLEIGFPVEQRKSEKKMKRYRIQKTEYEKILKYEPGDFFAMKCLIDILEKLGDKTQAKEYKSKLAIFKN